MKIRNKKTGEIVDSKELLTDDVINDLYSREFDYFNSKLHKILEEWEDYEEPKEWYYIDIAGLVKQGEGNVPTHLIEGMRQIGNYFEAREEAEKAVEKLKAAKRLKDKGFRFERWGIGGEYGNTITFSNYIDYNDETRADLDLLFGGEE